MSAKAMQKMANEVEKMLPSDMGFMILVFPFGKPGTANYISNANREDMIIALREKADILEQKKDFETPENNMY